MEEIMRVLTIQELMRLTRTELWGLASRINAKLPTFPEGSDRRLSSQHVPLFCAADADAFARHQAHTNGCR
jgi:hypothetical protein